MTFSAPLPDFTVKDLADRVWQLSDFRGRVTLLDFWATWCGACRGELPYIQKLYDRIKERKDLQVVTISVDDNPGLIEGYLKETHFTFPVLPAKDLAEKIFPVIMLPQTWIVDLEGRRSQDQFMGASDEWITSTIARMERVRGAHISARSEPSARCVFPSPLEPINESGQCRKELCHAAKESC